MDLDCDESSIEMESTLDYDENQEMKDIEEFIPCGNKNTISNAGNYSFDEMMKIVNFTWTPKGKLLYYRKNIKTIQRFFCLGSEKERGEVIPVEKGLYI